MVNVNAENGEHNLLPSFNTTSGRFEVEDLTSGEMVRVKPANLVVKDTVGAGVEAVGGYLPVCLLDL